MSETRPVQVVVAYDLSPSGEAALARAIEVVTRAPHHVLHVVTVLGNKGTYASAETLTKALRDHLSGELGGRAGERARRRGQEIQFFVHCRIGKPATEILGVAEDVGADLIFVGSHEHSRLEHVFSASTAERVVRDAKCPVMIVKPKGYKDVERERVVEYEHEHAAYEPPHRYSYVETRLLSRPADWPLN